MTRLSIVITTCAQTGMYGRDGGTGGGGAVAGEPNVTDRRDSDTNKHILCCDLHAFSTQKCRQEGTRNQLASWFLVPPDEQCFFKTCVFTRFLCVYVNRVCDYVKLGHARSSSRTVNSGR